MFAAIRRIALAVAGAAALVAAGRARADHDCDWQPVHPPVAEPPAYPPQDYPPVYPPAVEPAYPPRDYRPVYPPAVEPAYPSQDYPPAPPAVPTFRRPIPVLSFSLALPAPPAWLAVAPPPLPACGACSRVELVRESGAWHIISGL